MSDDMGEGPEPEPANLRFLRILVTVLTAVMIVGLLTVVTLLVQRLRAPSLQIPADLALPEGTAPVAITQGPGWWGVVTDDSRLLVFRPDGTLHGEIAVDLPRD